MFYRGLSLATFIPSGVILTLLNVGLSISLILFIVPTGVVLGKSIVLSNMIKKLPMFSSLRDKMKTISEQKQEIFKKNEETKKNISGLCKKLNNIKGHIYCKKEQISVVENTLTLYGYITADDLNKEIGRLPSPRSRSDIKSPNSLILDKKYYITPFKYFNNTKPHLKTRRGNLY